jgi:hypothetical protein
MGHWGATSQDQERSPAVTVLLSGPPLVAGFVRLRGWRPRNWLRVAGWAGSWVAGLALMNQAADWAVAGEGGASGVLSVGENYDDLHHTWLAARQS